MKDSVMRFGKHKGVRFKSIPVRYLLWLLDQNILPISEQVEIQSIIPTKDLIDYLTKNKGRKHRRRYKNKTKK